MHNRRLLSSFFDQKDGDIYRRFRKFYKSVGQNSFDIGI